MIVWASVILNAYLAQPSTKRKWKMKSYVTAVSRYMWYVFESMFIRVQFPL